jgi:hypothetical protein
MSNLEDLEQDWKDKESAAQKIMADKDEAMRKIYDKYAKRLKDATAEAAEAQKRYLDADAATALVGRDDGEIVANNLGLTEAYEAALADSE